MSNAKQVVDAVTEPKTAAEWQRKVEEYDITLAGPTLEPVIKTAIEKLRADAVQRNFLVEITAPIVVDAPVQQFVVPKVPDTMPVSVAENLKMYDLRITEITGFLKNHPEPKLIPGAETLLAEARASRARCLYDFQNPAPIPVPPPPPPIAMPKEVIEMLREIIRSEQPSIVSAVVQWFQKNPEWMRL